LFTNFPIEIFGHGGLSYNQAATDLNKLIVEHPNCRFTLVGLNEKGKAKSASLFFISKNGIMMDQIIFSNNTKEFGGIFSFINSVYLVYCVNHQNEVLI
jgi:hypothetical protein